MRSILKFALYLYNTLLESWFFGKCLSQKMTITFVYSLLFSPKSELLATISQNLSKAENCTSNATLIIIRPFHSQYPFAIGSDFITFYTLYTYHVVLSTSIYDLVLLDVCYFHLFLLQWLLFNFELSRYSSLYPRSCIQDIHKVLNNWFNKCIWSAFCSKHSVWSYLPIFQLFYSFRCEVQCN